MFNVFNTEDRKQYTKDKINKIAYLLVSIFKSENLAAWYVVFFLHYIPHAIIFSLFLYYPFNLSFSIVWLVGLVLHLFFNGCIHIRLERNLFNDKKWSGPYHILENFDIELNTETMNKYLYVGLTIITAIYIIKYIQYRFKSTNNHNKFPPELFFIKNKLFWALIIGWLIQFSVFIFI
jgi:hypothetical protein